MTDKVDYKRSMRPVHVEAKPVLDVLNSTHLLKHRIGTPEKPNSKTSDVLRI